MRILVVGTSGAGKTTLARRIARIVGVAAFAPSPVGSLTQMLDLDRQANSAFRPSVW